MTGGTSFGKAKSAQKAVARIDAGKTDRRHDMKTFERFRRRFAKQTSRATPPRVRIYRGFDHPAVVDATERSLMRVNPRT